MKTSNENESTPSHFELFNRFIEEGWFGRIKPIEAAVWFSMLKHRNHESGEAWPSASTLARYLMHVDPSRARKVRGQLAKMGLLVPISTSGGRDSAKYVVCLPNPSGIDARPNRTSKAIDPKENQPAADLTRGGFVRGHESSLPPATASVQNRHESSLPPATASTTQTEHRTPKETHQQQQPAADDGFLDSENEQASELRQLLRDRFKIGSPMNGRILEAVPGLTVGIIEKISSAIPDSPSIKNPSGLLASKLLAEGPDLVRAEREQEQREKEATERRRTEWAAREAASKETLARLIAEHQAAYDADAASVDSVIASIEAAVNSGGLGVRSYAGERLIHLGIGDHGTARNLPESVRRVLAVEEYHNRQQARAALASRPRRTATGIRRGEPADTA